MAVLKGGGSSTGINIPLSDILGNRYNGIFTRLQIAFGDAYKSLRDKYN